VIFHQNGGFWHLDPATGQASALEPSVAADRLSQMPRHTRFAAEPYPECWIVRSTLKHVSGTTTAMFTA
jgi:hypothetical protein